MADRKVSASRTIHTTPDRIFELLSDASKHSLVDGSGTVQGVRGESQRLTLGSTFGMDMKWRVSYQISNKVVEFEENRLIAWRHFAQHRWRWELEPIDEHSTKVTETFDYSTAPAGIFYSLIGFPEINRKSIVKSLDRLEELFPQHQE